MSTENGREFPHEPGPRSTAIIEDTLWSYYSAIDPNLAGVDAILDENLGADGEHSLRLRFVDGLEGKAEQDGQKLPDSQDEILVDLSPLLLPVGLNASDLSVVKIAKPPDQIEVNRVLYRSIQGYIDRKNSQKFVKPEDLRVEMDRADAVLVGSYKRAAAYIFTAVGAEVLVLTDLSQNFPEEVRQSLPLVSVISVAAFMLEALRGGSKYQAFKQAKDKYNRELKFGQQEARMTLAENAMDVRHGPIVTLLPKPTDHRIVY